MRRFRGAKGFLVAIALAVLTAAGCALVLLIFIGLGAEVVH